MDKKLLMTIILVVNTLITNAQDSVMTLSQCIAKGIENNLSLNAENQKTQLADISITENRNRLLPVIQASATFLNNTHRGTSVTDGSGISALLGLDIPYMKNQGLRYTTQAGFAASVPILDMTIFKADNVAKVMKEIAENSYEKAKEDLTIQIASVYYLAQTTNEQIFLIKKNIESLQSLDSIAKSLQNNGMALGVDVKRVEINLANLTVQHDNALSVFRQQLNILRYMMDLPIGQGFTVERINADNNFDGDSFVALRTDLYELKGLELQLQMLEKQREQVNIGYIPTISLVGNLSWANFTDHFENYFHDHPSNKWYNTTYWGIQAQWTVFDRFYKKNAAQKIKVNSDIIATKKADVEKSLQTKFQNSLDDYANNRRNLETRSENVRLADQVYEVAENQYRQGVTSMTVLLQDEINRTSTQNAYINALYKFLNSRLTLLKLTGQLQLTIDNS